MFKFRKPSTKGRISGKISPKRAIRHRAKVKIPKGSGMIVNPERTIKNKIYRKTSFGVEDIAKKVGPSKKQSTKKENLKSEKPLMEKYYQDLINQKSIEKNISSSGVVICSKCGNDNWAAVSRRLLFQKVVVMYCEKCGNQDGLAYEKFQELVKNNKKSEN